MLMLHEVHRVKGLEEKAFEAAFRGGWMPRLAEGDDARLLWFLHHAHGTGRSYQVVTITGLADGAAWERLARRVQLGDLQAWAREVDGYRHDVQGRLLVRLDFSPLEVDLASVPTDGRRHEPALYMEDTMWPKTGKVDAYLRAARDIYTKMLSRREGRALLRVEAAYQTLPGAGRNPEVTLLQKVLDMRQLVRLLTTDLPAEMSRPGSWMHDALAYRDQWRSRLLRTATWSPLH